MTKTVNSCCRRFTRATGNHNPRPRLVAGSKKNLPIRGLICFAVRFPFEIAKWVGAGLECGTPGGWPARHDALQQHWPLRSVLEDGHVEPGRKVFFVP